jgi:hypothetical protein
VSLLSAHPRIKTYNELFNLDSLPKETQREVLEDPIRFLQRTVYVSHASTIAAVGFKMFYDHLTKDYFNKAIPASETSPQLQAKFVEFRNFIENN